MNAKARVQEGRGMSGPSFLAALILAGLSSVFGVATVLAGLLAVLLTLTALAGLVLAGVTTRALVDRHKAEAMAARSVNWSKVAELEHDLGVFDTFAGMDWPGHDDAVGDTCRVCGEAAGDGR